MRKHISRAWKAATADTTKAEAHRKIILACTWLAVLFGVTLASAIAEDNTAIKVFLFVLTALSARSVARCISLVDSLLETRKAERQRARLRKAADGNPLLQALLAMQGMNGSREDMPFTMPGRAQPGMPDNAPSLDGGYL